MTLRSASGTLYHFTFHDNTTSRFPSRTMPTTFTTHQNTFSTSRVHFRRVITTITSQLPFLADYLCIPIKFPFIGLPFLHSLTPLPRVNFRFVGLLPFHCPYINFTFVGLSLLHNPALSAVLSDCGHLAARLSNILTVLRISPEGRLQ